ncbi:MAG: chloride channel protein [Gemmatimonadota bacterium]|nr:chloride channel protein [Gemmatimonadota bacterium]
MSAASPAMRAARAVGSWLLRRDVDEGWVLLALAALTGAAAGSAVILFYGLVDVVREAAGWAASRSGQARPWLALLLVPLGLWTSRRLLGPASGGAPGEMVPDLIRAGVRSDGRLPVSRMVRKLGAAALTLGSGGSLGAEGPVAVAGASVGSGLSQALRFGPRRTRVLFACGTAAGISAAFNAPIAGVLFALEIVLGTFAATALGPVVVASVMGAVVSRWVRGPDPAFLIPREYVFSSAGELPLYVALGIAGGLIAAVFVRGFFGVQDALGRLTGDRPGLAALAGGLAVAGLGFIHPQLLGDGRHGIELVLASRLTGLAALAFGLLKIVSSGLTMGAGGAGGVFTPSLFVGASFGSFYGLSAAALFPGLGVTPEAYALAGMAAVIAGATFAPLTAILIIFEMTDDYGLILPLMLVSVISYAVARRLTSESIYTEALRRSGDRIRHGADRSILEKVRVADCYDRDPDVLLEDAPLRDVLGRLKVSKQTLFPVVDRDLQLVGMLGYPDVARAIDAGLLDIVIAADLAQADVETALPIDSLLDATHRMGQRDIDAIPVVETEGSRRLVGLLDRGAIMEAYRTRLLLQEEGELSR